MLLREAVGLGGRAATGGQLCAGAARRGFATATTSGAPRRVTQVRVRGAERVLEVTFAPAAATDVAASTLPEEEEQYRYPAEYLRVYSPAAAPHRHEPAASATGPPLVVGRRHVGIINVRPVGNYAIQIEFDDLHDTGIYSWDYLHHLGAHKYSLMKQYLRRLQAAGMSREPSTRRKSFRSPPPPPS